MINTIHMDNGNSVNPSHDLYDFFGRANKDIELEYERIRKRSKIDPGTAGDQGEKNWKELLINWIPSYFPVVTKGQIINEDGPISPQVDVLILTPDYPRKLMECKQYLSGGVIAAFECKNTLRREDLNKFMKNSSIIKCMRTNDVGTPHKELNSSIYYGLLCHSHDWNNTNSRPKETIDKALVELDRKEIKSPYQMPNVICVASLCTWTANKIIVPQLEGMEKAVLETLYFKANETSELYTPVGG